MKDVRYDPKKETLRQAVQGLGGRSRALRRDDGEEPLRRTRARERDTKKFPGLLESGPRARFRFLKEHRGELGPVKKACALLKVSNQASTSIPDGRSRMPGSSARRSKGSSSMRSAGVRAAAAAGASTENCAAAASSRAGSACRISCGSQGSPPKGRPGGIRPQRRLSRATRALDLVERVFSVGERNRLRVGGMTCMPAREGRLCLAAAIDAFSRKAVGRPMPDRIAGKVAVDAIEQAAGREDPPHDGSLVFHGGQSVRYASKAFRRRLDSHGMTQPASGPGTPSGSAAAESFFKTLKRGLPRKDAMKQGRRRSRISSSTLGPAATGSGCIRIRDICLPMNTSGNALEDS